MSDIQPLSTPQSDSTARTLADDKSRVGEDPAQWQSAREEARKALEAEIESLESSLKEGALGKDTGLVDDITHTEEPAPAPTEALQEEPRETPPPSVTEFVQEIEPPPSFTPPPEPPPAKVLSRQEILHEEIAKKEREKIELLAKRKEQEIAQAPYINAAERLTLERKRMEEKLRPFLEGEAELNKFIEDARAREESAPTPAERHAAEQERWGYEDKRKELEARKWEVEKGLESHLASFEKAQAELDSVLRRLQVIDEKVKNCDKEIERMRLEIELVGISEHKEKLEVSWIQLNDERKKLALEQVSLEQNEVFAEAERKNLEEQEKTASTSITERDIEQKRHEVEGRLRDIEKKRWDIEARLIQIDKEIDQLKPSYQHALAREEDMKKRLASLDI